MIENAKILMGYFGRSGPHDFFKCIAKIEYERIKDEDLLSKLLNNFNFKTFVSYA